MSTKRPTSRTCAAGPSPFELLLGTAHTFRFLTVCSAAALFAGLTSSPAGAALESSPTVIYIQVDDQQPDWLAPRLHELLSGSTTAPVHLVSTGTPLNSLEPDSVVLAVGDTALTRGLIPLRGSLRNSLEPDGFALRIFIEDGRTIIASVGGDPADHYGISTNRGSLYGAYAALEIMGFSFLHPLDPFRPRNLRIPVESETTTQSPHWPVRGVHLHTMHPIELADVLNGWGEHGIDDDAGFGRMLREWELYCEWLVANRQNLVEWNLLHGKDWKEFAESRQRQQRLRQIVEIAHQYGMAVGVVVGIVSTQQNNFQLITRMGDSQREKEQIDRRIDYLMAAGFDFIGLEIGTTEFTAPKDTDMLRWINEVGQYVASRHGKKSHVKVHVSSGQEASSFPDPRTGHPINYNFLPHFAIPEVGVLPHTVQFYGLDDHAPTYGNDSFAPILEFMKREAGRRNVYWYPETAYWASFDVDVPLFLPIYAERRLHDLRIIAELEHRGEMGEGDHAGARIQGQIFFSSGWEWGYWLNDVIAARAAFDPLMQSEDDEDAFRTALASVLRPFGETAHDLADKLASIARDQKDLLIDGRFGDSEPTSHQPHKLNGQAYLQGWDTFDDIAAAATHVERLPRIMTQPLKLGFVSLRYGFDRSMDYDDDLRPLHQAMVEAFARHDDALRDMLDDVPVESLPILVELTDGTRINALRARQILGLYSYVAGLYWFFGPSADAKAMLKDAREALDEGLQITASRQLFYRAPIRRLTGWRDNPTAYPFGYLWTVKNLFYWWRDEGKAVRSPLSPCYLNVLDLKGVATSETTDARIGSLLKSLLVPTGWSWIADCMTAPSSEPTYPPKGLR